MFGLLVIFGQLWDEPWYGKNTSLMEGLPTGLHDVELTGGYFLSVPAPVAAQRYTRAAINVGNEPQRPGRRQDHTQRVGTNAALPLAALVLPEPGEGVTVTDRNFYDPAVAIRAHDLFCAQGEICRKKRLDRWEWFSRPRLFRGRGARPSEHDDPHEAPWQDGVPQAI